MVIKQLNNKLIDQKANNCSIN